MFAARVKRLEEEFWRSEFFNEFIHSVLLRHGLVLPSVEQDRGAKRYHVSANRISKVICLGLGKFTSSKQKRLSRTSLAFKSKTARKCTYLPLE